MSEQIRFADLLATLPPEPETDPLPHIQAAVSTSDKKLVVLDDDPTGTQTVHGIPIVTEWSVSTLRRQLSSDYPAFFILTNSRSLAQPEAIKLNQEIGKALVKAAEGQPFTVASRSDSTLRGHYPAEVNALTEALGGGFDALLLLPAFFAGGRLTINDTHYVTDGDWLIPAGETEFARDASFGYHASNLRDWVIEKTAGQVDESQIFSVSLDTIRVGGHQAVAQQLVSLPTKNVCIVNAATRRDLAIATLGIVNAEAQGKRFVYRTSATFVALRIGLDQRPLLTSADLHLPHTGGGLVVVGSYVQKTTRQLERLLREKSGVEVQVSKLLDVQKQQTEIERVTQEIDSELAQNRDIVVYTSRQLITADNPEQSLQIGRVVSESLVTIVQRLQTRPRFILAKGGITSSDVATKGLGVKTAMVLGQIMPGVPVWQLGDESRFPGMVYIVFPGNVGDDNAVLNACRKVTE